MWFSEFRSSILVKYTTSKFAESHVSSLKKERFFNSKLEILRHSNFDAAYNDMCNVQNNDLDLPMRVYQKASKPKKKRNSLYVLATFYVTCRICLGKVEIYSFSNFSCMFLNNSQLFPIFFSNLNSSCSNLSDMRNLQEQLKKAFC